MRIQYDFALDDQPLVTIAVEVDREPRVVTETASFPGPEWTRLTFNQCPNCPLPANATDRCPAAADLMPVLGPFGQLMSYDIATVTVQLPDRVVEKSCQVQDALSSLMGLIMATSACPILSRMKGLARTHLPFATHEETLMRTVGSFLIRQVIDGGRFSTAEHALAGLRDHYADLEILNRAFRQRLRSVGRQDAALNAVSALGVLSLGVGLSIEDRLCELDSFVYRPTP